MNFGTCSRLCEDTMKYLVLAIFVLFLLFVLSHTYMVVTPLNLLAVLAIGMVGSFLAGRWSKKGVTHERV